MALGSQDSNDNEGDFTCKKNMINHRINIMDMLSSLLMQIHLFVFSIFCFYTHDLYIMLEPVSLISLFWMFSLGNLSWHMSEITFSTTHFLIYVCNYCLKCRFQMQPLKSCYCKAVLITLMCLQSGWQGRQKEILLVLHGIVFTETCIKKTEIGNCDYYLPYLKKYYASSDQTGFTAQAC